MSRPYEICVVDPNSLSCEGLRHALPSRKFSVRKSWSHIEDALKMGMANCPCDALLINLSQQTLPSGDTIMRLREALPQARIALIAETNDAARIDEATRLELDGYLIETISIDAISKAIELIILGVRVFPVLPAAPSKAAEPPALPKPAETALETLSASELRVLALLAKARANKVIARDLDISESTVKVHVKAILRKTGSRNRTDAALLVRDIGAIGYLQDMAQRILDEAPSPSAAPD